MVDLYKKMTHAKYFFCNAKIATVQALWNFEAPLMEVKILLHQKYGFMVLPGKALRSRIGNFCPLYLAWDNLKKPLKIGQFSINIKKFWFFSDF